MLTAQEIADMANVIDLEAERRARRVAARNPAYRYRDGLDAWFALWCIPAQVYLTWVRGLHQGMRSGQ